MRTALAKDSAIKRKLLSSAASQSSETASLSIRPGQRESPPADVPDTKVSAEKLT